MTQQARTGPRREELTEAAATRMCSFLHCRRQFFTNFAQFFQVLRSKQAWADTLMSAMTQLSNSNQTIAAMPSDRDLLRRFIHDGDEASFAAIVERHASLVMSVCRRVLGRSPDVDDAFQATFFALSQRPAGIYECRSLSGWLYSVAWRTSVRLVRLRKRMMTQPLPDQVPATEPDPLDVIAEANDLASLDEELHRLPQKYRDVLVMSYFSQQTSHEIADQLNESKGAIDGRIRDARRMLRVRLARRGVDVGVLAAAATYMQSSASAASPALIQKTICMVAPGLAAPPVPSMNAAELARMKCLTSTGVPLMSKIGLTVAAGLLLASGLRGISHLAAYQDGTHTGEISATDGGDRQQDNDGSVELTGQATVEPQAAAIEGGDVFGTASESGNSSLANASLANVPSNAARDPLRRGGVGAITEFTRRSERDAERQLNEMMQDTRSPALAFPGENPLSDILNLLQTRLSDSLGRPILILPDRQAFEDEGLASLQDITIADIGIPENLMTVGSAIDHILTQTPLTWIARDELLLITTKAAAQSEDNMFLRSYDITWLREISQLTTTVRESGYPGGGFGGSGMEMGMYYVPARPAQSSAGGSMDVMGAGMGGMGGGGMGGMGGGGSLPRTRKTGPSKPQTRTSGSEQPEQDAVMTWEEGLLRTIQDLTAPPCLWFEFDGEGGKMSIAGNRLIVRQSRKGHEQVVAVLEQLELAAEDIAGAPQP